MKEAGVKILLTGGVTAGTGIQHSKTLLADEHVIIGSTNWTNSSKLNQEMSMLVRLNLDGMAAYDERLRHLKKHGRALTYQDLGNGQGIRDQRARSLSTPAAERYATARRFSIAAARARSVDEVRRCEARSEK